MPSIVPPNAQQPIVNDSGVMLQVFRAWANSITSLDLIIGSGSPETAVQANQGRLYMDEAGPAGSVLYIKQLASIGGDRSLGWVAIG